MKNTQTFSHISFKTRHKMTFLVPIKQSIKIKLLTIDFKAFYFDENVTYVKFPSPSNNV